MFLPGMPQDRRHFKRYGVEKVWGSLPGAKRLVVHDFSLTGLAVETLAPMTIGQSYPPQDLR